MRKLLLLSLALTVLMSCKKDDETGIPPIDGQQKQSSSVLDAKTATINDYKDGKKVSLKGNITVKGTYSYIIFSDKTEVQIFAHKSIVENFSQETKKKLATQGQEVTVTGTFKDHKLKNGTVIKEILYEKEEDLVFGNVTAPNETITELDAKTATVNDYKDGKKVKLKGIISVENNKSYIKLSDQTPIQIYSVSKNVFDALSPDTKTKLNTNGQEVTVTGTFKNFTPKNSNNIIREIIYEKEEDLVFGSSSATPTPPANDTVTELDAKTATTNDYVSGKKVKLSNAVISVENNKSYIKLSDQTSIQVYVPSNAYKVISENTKTKLKTNGQELTITGTFKDYNGTKQIICEKEEDLVFGNVQNNNQNGGNQNGNQGGGNQSGNTTSNVFDFESITPSNHYNETGTLTGADGVTLTYKARTDVDKFGITGKGLMLTEHKTYGLSYIKITFPNGVKEISFDYKEAFSGNQDRHFLVYEGDENSTTKIDEVKFKGQNKYTKELNKNGSYTITIKVAKGTRQFVIDNFSWK